MFRNQATQMEKLIANAKQCVNDFEDPDKENVTIKDVRKMWTPLEGSWSLRVTMSRR